MNEQELNKKLAKNKKISLAMMGKKNALGHKYIPTPETMKEYDRQTQGQLTEDGKAGYKYTKDIFLKEIPIIPLPKAMAMFYSIDS